MGQLGHSTHRAAEESPFLLTFILFILCHKKLPALSYSHIPDRFGKGVQPVLSGLFHISVFHFYTSTTIFKTQTHIRQTVDYTKEFNEI